MVKKFIFILTFFILSFKMTSQNMVFSYEQQTTSLEMKWYSEKLTHNEGVYVYRKTPESEWELISDLILPKQYKIESGQLASDSTLKDLVDIFNEEERNEERFPLLTINYMFKSFESRDWSKYLGIYFKDKNTEPNVNYLYKVVTFDKELVSESMGIVPSKVGVIAPPKEVGLKKIGRSVKFSWLEETTRYYAVNIYRKAPDETVFAKQNRLPIITSENEDKIYYEQRIPHIKGVYRYKLQAIDFWGSLSDFTPEETVVFKNSKKVSPAFSFRADTVITDYALLKWSYGEDEKNQGFKLYYKKSLKGKWRLYDDVLIDKDIRVLRLENIPSGDHYFSVSSLNEDGIPSHSNVALVVIEDITPPEQVTNLSGKMIDRKVLLTWGESEANDLHSYLVYKSFTGEEYLLLSSNGMTENTFSSTIDKRVKTKLYFKIVARDSSMNSSKYSEPIVIKVKDVFPPSVPVIKRVKVSEGISEISWVKNKEPDLKGYKVRRCKASNCQIIANDIDSESSSYNDFILENLGEVEYSISALDTSGNESAFSEAFKVRTQTKKTTQEIALEVKHKKEKYKLKWNELTDLKKLYVLIILEGKTERKELKLEENKYKYEGDADSILLKGYFKNGTIVKSNHWTKSQGNE